MNEDSLIISYIFKFISYFCSLSASTFLGSSIPNDHYSFVDYISDHTKYECLQLECVKVSKVRID